jgi:hypothetical protein
MSSLAVFVNNAWQCITARAKRLEASQMGRTGAVAETPPSLAAPCRPTQ